jgi:hypothetical protein
VNDRSWADWRHSFPSISWSAARCLRVLPHGFQGAPQSLHCAPGALLDSVDLRVLLLCLELDVRAFMRSPGSAETDVVSQRRIRAPVFLFPRLAGSGRWPPSRDSRQRHRARCCRRTRLAERFKPTRHNVNQPQGVRPSKPIDHPCRSGTLTTERSRQLLPCSRRLPPRLGNSDRVMAGSSALGAIC